MKTHEFKPHRLFWAILILGGGVLLLLSALGIGVESDPFRIIGSVLLLGVAVTSLFKLQFFFTLVPLAGIAYLWRDPLGVPNLELWPILGAAALLGIGLSILFRRKPPFPVVIHRHGKTETLKDCTDCAEASEETVNADESVEIESTFGEQTKYIHAQNLKRVSIHSNFSEVKVYFDQCKVDEGGLTIQVDGNFTGIVLTIPRTWTVENKTSTFAASVTERGLTSENRDTTVRLAGSLNFGEIKIVRV